MPSLSGPSQASQVRMTVRVCTLRRKQHSGDGPRAFGVRLGAILVRPSWSCYRQEGHRTREWISPSLITLMLLYIRLLERELTVHTASAMGYSVPCSCGWSSVRDLRTWTPSSLPSFIHNKYSPADETHISKPPSGETERVLAVHPQEKLEGDHDSPGLAPS
ncbi:hypothetical protein BV20DRAFT_443327 [Pilatotrama ljubarskyi]|nr:hypothetical protein BV20DRAFT_443327 [Pilatotrama ljubarskyi]